MKKTGKEAQDAPAKPWTKTVHFVMPEDEQIAIAKRQGEHFQHLAEKVDRGEALTDTDLGYVIFALRLAADNRFNFTPKRPPGQAPTICHASLALDYDLLRHDGKSKVAAYGHLSETYGISIEAVKKSLKKQGWD